MDLLNALSTVQTGATFINYSAPQVIFNLLLALVLSVMTALVYQFTHRGYSYSKNYVTSLIIICLISTFVMMVIGNSLARAFALLGTFSIIRFRTAVKDTKDIAFIFLVLVIGMASGTNNYVIGLSATLVILAVIVLLDRINITGAEKTQYTLSVFVKSGKDKFNLDNFGKFLKQKNLLSVSSRDNGRFNEYVYSVDFKRSVDTSDFIIALNRDSKVEKTHLFSTKEEIEY